MTPSLFLITPPLAADSAPLLQRVLDAAPFSSAWLRFATMDEREQLALAKQLVPLVQNRSAAALVDASDPRFASRCGADGLHVRYSESAVAAMSSVRPERILGFGGLKHRDDAMTAGENADYVMFGEPAADGYVPPLDTVIERCLWWTEVFETPCIAYAPALNAVAALVETRAEFIALGPWIFEGDPAQSLRPLPALLSGAARPTR
jgi:thiamine-phosphate pyrophosphorylase